MRIESGSFGRDYKGTFCKLKTDGGGGGSAFDISNFWVSWVFLTPMYPMIRGYQTPKIKIPRYVRTDIPGFVVAKRALMLGMTG